MDSTSSKESKLYDPDNASYVDGFFSVSFE